MRPVNLIPPEQRRGSARIGSSRRSATPAYIVLGALGAGVLCVLALVLTGNDVKAKTAKLADLRSNEQGAKTVADALRPYGQFALVQAGRQQQIQQVAENRFDWDHAIDQLARTTPGNVWLVSATGTVGAAVQVESGGDSSNLRDGVDAPTLGLVGCTFSQRSVARMMARMQNLDGVTEVKFSKSEKRDQADSGGDGAPAAAPAGDASQDQEDCAGSGRVTKFEILVVFGDAPVATAATAEAGVPQSSAGPAAKATAAAGQAAPAASTSTAGGGQ